MQNETSDDVFSKMNTMQNETFVIQYGIKSDRCNHKSIECFNTLTDSLEEFLERDCSGTKFATVVFNGYGSPNGLLFRNGETIPLDQILAKLQDIIKNIHRGRENLRHVAIVFAQGYGHLHSYNSKSGTTGLDAVSVTSKIHPIEKVFNTLDPHTFQLIES